MSPDCYLHHPLPGNVYGNEDVSPKGHRKGCRPCFAKADGCCCRPFKVSARRSLPFPMPRGLASAWVVSVPDMGGYNGSSVLLCNKVRHTHFLLFNWLFLTYRFCTGTIMAVLSLITGSLRLIYGHTSCCTAWQSVILGEIWVSQMSACNGYMTAHGCAIFLLLPLSHAFNPLSIASLRRVVAGLNRCGTFRIQQQVLHSDSGILVPAFWLWYLFLFSLLQYSALHPSGSIVPFPGYKVERVAFGMRGSQSLYKDTKKIWGFQIRTNSRQCGHLVSYYVFDVVGVEIAATSVPLEHRYRHRCMCRVCTRTPIVFA